MARVADRIDGFLGRLVFRTLGLVCAVIALICAYAVWSYLRDWQDDSLGPTILFAVLAAVAAACVPYCFSRKRSFVEALDAMEDEVPNFRKPEESR